MPAELYGLNDELPEDLAGDGDDAIPPGDVEDPDEDE